MAAPATKVCECATSNIPAREHVGAQHKNPPNAHNTSCSRLTGQRTYQHTPAPPARPSEVEGETCPNHACPANPSISHSTRSARQKEWSLLPHKCCMASTHSTRTDAPPTHPRPPHRKTRPTTRWAPTPTPTPRQVPGAADDPAGCCKRPQHRCSATERHLSDPLRQRPAACWRCRHCPQLPIITHRIPSAALQHAPCNQHTPGGG